MFSTVFDVGQMWFFNPLSGFWWKPCFQGAKKQKEFFWKGGALQGRAAHPPTRSGGPPSQTPCGEHSTMVTWNCMLFIPICHLYTDLTRFVKNYFIFATSINQLCNIMIHVTGLRIYDTTHWPCQTNSSVVVEMNIATLHIGPVRPRVLLPTLHIGPVRPRVLFPTLHIGLVKRFCCCQHEYSNTTHWPGQTRGSA
jgi:hypothetical protein